MRYLLPNLPRLVAQLFAGTSWLRYSFDEPSRSKQRTNRIPVGSLMVRFTAHLMSKALVWLAAMLVPVQATFPGTCGCDEPGSPHGNGHCSLTAPAHEGQVGCCHHTKRSGCGAASGTGRCLCCQSRTAASPGSTPTTGACRCVSQSRTPTPIPANDSRVVKEVLHQANLAAGSLFVFKSQPDNSLTPWDFAALPATSLERLSALCRFLI